MTGMREDLDRKLHHRQPRTTPVPGLPPARHAELVRDLEPLLGAHSDITANRIAPLIAEWINEARVPAVFLADDHEECDRQIRAARATAPTPDRDRLIRVAYEAEDRLSWAAAERIVDALLPHLTEGTPT